MPKIQPFNRDNNLESVDSSLNSIDRDFGTALSYEQSIFWGSTSIESLFWHDTIHVLCTCKYYNNNTINDGRCCKHIIGHLRRTVYLS